MPSCPLSSRRTLSPSNVPLETAGDCSPCVWRAARVNVKSILIATRNAQMSLMMWSPPRQFQRWDSVMQTRTSKGASCNSDHNKRRVNQENEERTLLPNVPGRIFANGSIITTLLLRQQNSRVCFQLLEAKKKTKTKLWPVNPAHRTEQEKLVTD